MRHLKILWLLAVATAALIAVPTSASATTVTTTTGGAAATPTIHFVSEEGASAGTKHILLHNPNSNIACESTAEWKAEAHGVNTADGFLSNLSFTGCTSGWTFTVVSKGRFILHYTSGHNGTLTWSNATITGTLNLGIFGHITCNYLTNETDVGTLTGGNPATLDIKAVIPFESGSGLCGGNANWTGNYATTSALYVAP